MVLIGFMGAGKSTVGSLLAQRLGWQFVDSDHLLTQQGGSSIAEIFARHGEQHFRALEAALIASLLQTSQAVIALGGGAVEHPQTAKALTAAAQTSGTLVVYLEAPLALSLQRCAAEPGAAVRPILQTFTQDTSALKARFHQRLPLYQAAALTVPTADLTPAQVADSIAAHLRNHPAS